MKLPKEAIWLMLLAAVLLLLISKMHGESPRHYQKRIEKRLISVNQRLREMVARDMQTQTFSESVYVTRGTIDVSLAIQGFQYYRAGQIPKSEMERLMKQLDRDMEDYPPQVAGK